MNAMQQHLLSPFPLSPCLALAEEASPIGGHTTSGGKGPIPLCGQAKRQTPLSASFPCLLQTAQKHVLSTLQLSDEKLLRLWGFFVFVHNLWPACRQPPGAPSKFKDGSLSHGDVASVVSLEELNFASPYMLPAASPLFSDLCDLSQFGERSLFIMLIRAEIHMQRFCTCELPQSHFSGGTRNYSFTNMKGWVGNWCRGQELCTRLATTATCWFGAKRFVTPHCPELITLTSASINLFGTGR